MILHSSLSIDCKSLHQRELNLSTLFTPKPLLPHLLSKIITYRLSFSVMNLHFHFPIKAKLKAIKFFIPKPPIFLSLQILFHCIQQIFLRSKSPPHKKFLNKDSSFKITRDLCPVNIFFPRKHNFLC